MLFDRQNLSWCPTVTQFYRQFCLVANNLLFSVGSHLSQQCGGSWLFLFRMHQTGKVWGTGCGGHRKYSLHCPLTPSRVRVASDWVFPAMGAGSLKGGFLEASMGLEAHHAPKGTMNTIPATDGVVLSTPSIASSQRCTSNGLHNLCCLRVVKVGRNQKGYITCAVSDTPSPSYAPKHAPTVFPPAQGSNAPAHANTASCSRSSWLPGSNPWKGTAKGLRASPAPWSTYFPDASKGSLALCHCT